MDGRILSSERSRTCFGHMCDSFNSVASGIAHWLHDGWGHSYPAGHRHHRVSDPTYSGTKVMVAICTLAGEGEVFGEEVKR